MKKPHVVILGGGFGGLATAKSLRRAPVRVTLVDQSNHHLFQPLLYQVATSALTAPDIAAPLRKLLRQRRPQPLFPLPPHRRHVFFDRVRSDFMLLLLLLLLLLQTPQEFPL